MTQPYEPLGSSLNAGYVSGRGTESPGLEEQNARFNALTQASIERGPGEVSQAPTSVLQQRAMSPNGMSAQQAENRMINGAMMNNTNGMSSGTQQEYNQVKMLGGAG